MKLKVKPKPGDREPTSVDYESIEEDEEENTIDGEGKCSTLSIYSVCLFVVQNNGKFVLGVSLDDEDRTIAYQVPAKNINGSR